MNPRNVQRDHDRVLVLVLVEKPKKVDSLAANYWWEPVSLPSVESPPMN